mmetsp:Transcript_36014/g.85251  ORF Transcript_36014/g.85251 Transcript_36014/m.85251 type:complete len:205 (+) Transcript_36014:719-1333(+)
MGAPRVLGDTPAPRPTWRRRAQTYPGGASRSACTAWRSSSPGTTPPPRSSLRRRTLTSARGGTGSRSHSWTMRRSPASLATTSRRLSQRPSKGSRRFLRSRRTCAPSLRCGETRSRYATCSTGASTSATRTRRSKHSKKRWRTASRRIPTGTRCAGSVWQCTTRQPPSTQSPAVCASRQHRPGRCWCSSRDTLGISGSRRRSSR